MASVLNTPADRDASMNEQDPNETHPEDSVPDDAQASEPEGTAKPAAPKDGPTFAELPLAPAVREAIETMGYETPSPIQARAIPFLAEGRDLLGVAQTGTGKTAAFALPLLSQLDFGAPGPQVLCLAPTRELAIQVAEAIEGFAQRMEGFRVLTVYGGTEYHGQLRALRRGVNVVVGTPGRVMDHVKRGSLNLDALQALVLDEADEMLGMGFLEDVEWILEQTPEGRQTALFSATMPKGVRKLAEKHLREPAEVTIKLKAATAPNIRQRFIKRRHGEKLETLLSILDVEEYDAALIFARTKASTSELAERLLAKGVAAEALNGDMPQSLREKTVLRLKEGKLNVLVATDVAARGLDVDRISLVVNYDAPFDVESYVHRVGRTGRAGRSGEAVLFVTPKEFRILKAIERVTKNDFETYEFPTVAELNERKAQRLFARIDETLNADFSDYREVLVQYLAEREGTDPLALAAALARMEAGGKPFLLKKLPTGARSKERKTREAGKERHPARESRRRDEHTGERSFSKYDSDDRQWTTYRIEVGEEHGAGKGDVVGALANEVGLEPAEIGKIRLFPYFGLVDLPQNLPEEIVDVLKNVYVRGRRLEITKDKGRPSFDGKSKRPRHKKFGGKFAGKGKGGGKFGPKSFRPKKGPR